VWTEPTVVAEVEYGSWPADALLRHPVYAGLRIDRDPGDIVRELPP
jgi:bifunctional non-homologous end joining protein LigD